ncbi:MAG: acyl-CoA dehydratase activase [Halanaerobiales bacterium]|nr:acyl-CoA dehydratase activase [Halanaerobiales bacterium]
MYSLGIDIGYSSIKISLLNSENEIVWTKYILHKGRIKNTLKNSIKGLLNKYNLCDIKFGAVTGNGSKFLTKAGEVKFVNEVAAIVEGGIRANRNIGSIIEIGGESAKYITEFSENDQSRIKIAMNSNCSAGTGSFLEEQMSRLNLRLEDYSVYAGRANSIPRIAGRCSVFAKTDITHHQQEGVAVEDILLGLAYAVVKNYRGAVMKKLPMKKPILFVGGVAHNQGMITALKDVLNLDEGELIIPDYFSNIGAIGTAMIAQKDHIKIDLEKLLANLELAEEVYAEENNGFKLPGLIAFGAKDSLDKHVCKIIASDQRALKCYLGIDVGSTSTNLVLINNENAIISYQYLPTLGNPIAAVRKGLEELKEEIGNRADVVGVCITGSGRYMIGQFIGADLIKDEITAQAKAAVTIDDSIETIFEIGGQDSKYISLKDGVVTDFQMNKICAAGTGSFIEEQSKKFNIPINDFGEIALSSNNPLSLGERCTVFIETSIAANLARGAKIEDIAAGLCYSVVKNYLNRVVGRKRIGNKVFLQGGIAYNQGIINAFRAITGKEICIPPFFSITGAWGAAILAKEEAGIEKTKFKGFDGMTKEVMVEKPTKEQVAGKATFNQLVNDLVFAGYDGKIDDSKKTVGIPRALFTYGMYPMFSEFFKELGFNILLSEQTDDNTIRLGQEYSLDETCYPVKLINGHVAELVQKNVDYIFFPDLFTVAHPGSHSRQDYGCAYMQLAFKIVKQAMELEQKGIELLAPTIAFNLGPEFMKESWARLGEQLGKSPEETNRALQKGIKAFHQYEKRIGENGKRVVAGLKPDEKAFVIISKTYGVVDPVLNMSIPDQLMSMGYKVLSFFDLPEGDLTVEYPNMYWPFGQHILEAAQIVKQHPNLYAIYLSHHCCGPDTVLTHYFREIMGEKPYLNIEVDEHSSGVGVITRVEAFVNSLSEIENKKAARMEPYPDIIVHKEANIKNTLAGLTNQTILYLPYIAPYAELFKELLSKKGIDARVLPMTNRVSIDLGRRHTMTNEYLSLAALLGDVLKKTSEKNNQDNIAIFVPRTEGAEVDGQYNRLLRTKLDEEGFKNVDIVAPFIEDLLDKDEEEVELIFLGLLAGDLIRLADKKSRPKYLDKILDLIKKNNFKVEQLKEIARELYEELKTINYRKRVLAIGEALILYNDYLGNLTFSNLEDKGHKVIYAPLSETMWVFWKDFIDNNQNKQLDLEKLQQRLNILTDYIDQISECLLDESYFEKDLNHLITNADHTVGYYSGANGRYREAKTLGDLSKIDGIITVASMYENTGIAINILQRGFEKRNPKPLLNLTFDGNKNENDQTKLESFIYYIGD